MKESLKGYLKKLEYRGFLKKENIGIDQIRALLASASKNIVASEKNLSIDEEACYILAYNVMLKIARPWSSFKVIDHLTDSNIRQPSMLQEKYSEKNSEVL